VAGAIAGTAIFRCRKQPRLQLVALTINNSCNLRCPHCYLQYAGAPRLVSQGLVHAILETEVEHVALVGKEPLFDDAARRACEEIADAALLAGKSVSLVTNGLGLGRSAPSLLRKLAFVDVSFDGGPLTYGRYRRGSYDRLAAGLRHAATSGVRELNALHVLSSGTIDHIEDMMQVRQVANFRRVMFSLYFESENDGQNFVSPLSLERALTALAASRSFREDSAALFLVDLPLLPGYTESRVRDCAEALGLQSKVHVVVDDPLLYGIVRVTYDGLVLPPLASVHPRRYRAMSVPMDGHTRPSPLEQIYRTMLPRAA